MKKIIIRKSRTADTRTCDWSKVSKEELLNASHDHINDVYLGMDFLAAKLKIAACIHDKTKLDGIDQFHADFKTGFKNTTWWEMHQREERHHLKDEKYVPEDVNLLDVLEMIVDGVMAGLARSGEYRKEEIPDALLRKAFDNTIDMMLDVVEIKEAPDVTEG